MRAAVISTTATVLPTGGSLNLMSRGLPASLDVEAVGAAARTPTPEGRP